jgi:signal transduction histidine kinase
MLSFEALKRGAVGVTGSTSELLNRSLIGLRNLIDRTIAEVRLGARLQNREVVLLSDLIEEIEISALIEAQSRGFQLQIPKVAPGVYMEINRGLVTSAIGNLLQNAFKFSHPRSQITLRATATEERVLIDVEDECGGLSTPNQDTLLRPFAQQDENRTGLGLGLSICRQAVGANDGKLSVRNLPGRGCIFTIDLPRSFLPAR